MKIIHTGDWHIGKIVHQVYMTEDQRYILNEFIELLKVEKPDAIVIAGDLYDRSVPPVEAVELLDEVFTKILLELKIPILAIAGNHDSPDRVGFANKILKDKGLYISGRFNKNIEPVVLKDEYGPVNFCLIPYADPAIIRDIYEDDEIKTHDIAMKVILENIKKNMKADERNVIVAHGFVTAGMDLETCESERPLSVGGTELINASYFDDFNYTALGHLHGQQKVGLEKIRYSGSLLKYSFSEVKQNKSITIVNLDKDGEVSIEQKSLKPVRDMREIKGEIERLLDPEVYKDTDIEDYLSVILTDEGELLEPMARLRSVYPNVLKLEKQINNLNNEDSKTSAGKDYKKKTKLQLFEEFYSSITGKEFTDDKKDVLVEVLKKVEGEDIA